MNTISSNSEPVYGLGIDTGGTYTDAVIMDLRTDGVLAKAKARTTHDDLSIGLRKAIDAVLAYMAEETFEPSSSASPQPSPPIPCLKAVEDR